MPIASATGTIHQAAAIPIRLGQVCMVTSRGGKRWVVPKGNLEPNKTTGEVALLEAWEEAGLVGVLHPDPVGSYLYEKAGITCHVLVYLMVVTQMAEEWPERNLRERLWLSFPEAILRTEEAGLREILRLIMDRQAG